jgi:hypothetical protein
VQYVWRCAAVLMRAKRNMLFFLKRAACTCPFLLKSCVCYQHATSAQTMCAGPITEC